MSDSPIHDYDPELERQADVTRYPGTEASVVYDRRRCMHAGECGRASKGVFDGKRGKWIEPDEAESVEALIAVVRRCPTGALQIEVGGEALADPEAARNEVIVSPDGPLYARGRFEIHGRIETRVALCRCGASQNKPFCDNSHVRLRFRDAGPVNSDPGEDPGPGVVKVTAFDGGPVELSGPCTLRSASGRAARTDSPMYVCRCGNSKNKPFCDGSHRTEGFRSVGE
ncbi:MAG: CDGSH iron-sulfur domain-containing protein [Alphaproteobacteria bacterium]|nr:CDGSH iron-sulfur domain-containing protein [Alphaproteobacteria bacterium]